MGGFPCKKKSTERLRETGFPITRHQMNLRDLEQLVDSSDLSLSQTIQAGGASANVATSMNMTGFKGKDYQIK